MKLVLTTTVAAFTLPVAIQAAPWAQVSGSTSCPVFTDGQGTNNCAAFVDLSTIVKRGNKAYFVWQINLPENVHSGSGRQSNFSMEANCSKRLMKTETDAYGGYEWKPWDEVPAWQGAGELVCE